MKTKFKRLAAFFDLEYCQFFMLKTLCTLCVVFLFASCWANDDKESLKKQERRDFYGDVANYDFSSIWRHDQQYQEFEDIESKISQRILDIPPKETIGFIGSDYRRFYIRHNKVVKDLNDLYLYHVSGLTRVGNHINNFTGTLRVRKATLYKYSFYGYYPNLDAAAPHPDEKPFEYGSLEVEVLFNEVPGQAHAGVFKGELRSSFHLVKGAAYLVTTNVAGDFIGNANNYQTTWNDNLGRQSKTCNWTQGDWIPGGETLLWRGDSREVFVREQYESHGWKNYGIKGYGSDEEQAIWERANKAEQVKWWLRQNKQSMMRE